MELELFLDLLSSMISTNPTVSEFEFDAIN